MAYALRPGVSFCVIENVALFLDLARDRYFRLPPESNDLFLRLVAGEIGYDLAALVDAGVLIRTDVTGALIPATTTMVTEQAAAVRSGPFQLGEVARALWTQRRIEQRIAARGIAANLVELGHAQYDQPIAPIVPGSGPGAIIRAFEQARLLRSAADRCLPRSIALGLCLARRQCRVRVVLGVKLDPFAAHCWVQAGSEVLNDTPEEIARYTPILVI